jgi:hypothetical protein
VSSTQAIANPSLHEPVNFQPRLDFNRYGGALGGPVIKNKLFLFADYERQEDGTAASGSTLCAPTAAGISALNSLNFSSATNLQVFEKYYPVATAAAPAGGNTACTDSNSNRYSGRFCIVLAAHLFQPRLSDGFGRLHNLAEGHAEGTVLV